MTTSLDDARPGLDEEPGGPTAPAPRRRRRKRRLLVMALLCVVALLGIPAAATLYLAHQLESHLHRVPDVFAGIPEQSRPPRPTTGPAAAATNILLIGTDRRSEVPTTGSAARAPAFIPGQQRSDTLMVVHVSGDRRSVSVVSIPRDSWVDVPGHGMGKVNAAFSYGGPSLAVQTVEQLTGVRIDHVAMVDWDGFSALIDAVGGVEVYVPRTVFDSARDVTWTAGRHVLDGDRALDYVGQRYGLPGGDLDRVRRQQAVLRSLGERTFTSASSRDPRAVYRLLDTVTRHLSVDDGWSGVSMGKLVLSLRNLELDDVQYLTIPVRGTGMVGDQSVVFTDPRADRALWDAVREDRMPRWAAEHPDELTPEVVR